MKEGSVIQNENESRKDENQNDRLIFTQNLNQGRNSFKISEQALDQQANRLSKLKSSATFCLKEVFQKGTAKLLFCLMIVFMLSAVILAIAYFDLEFKLRLQSDKINQLQSSLNQLREASYYSYALHSGEFRMRKNRPRMAPIQDIQKDKYDLNGSVEDLIRKSNLQNLYKNSDDYNNVKKFQFQRAIRLLELVHNINSKGEFQFDHYRHYESAFDKYVALKKLVTEQKQYYEQKYNISKYIHNQIRFCIFTTSYNNARNRLYMRNLDSIFQQQYQNYHIVYASDASTDGTAIYVKAYMEVNQIPKDKYTIIQNKKNQGGGANLYMAAHQYCQLGQVMLLIDGDDALIGRQVFALLNAVYQKEKPLLLYTQFLYIFPQENIIAGTCHPIPEEILKSDSFRDNKKLYSSHIKTMYVDLYRKIRREDLEYQKGKIFAYGADVSFMTPMIEMAGQRVYYLAEPLYEYRSDTGSNDPGDKQREAAEEIFSRPKYSRITQTQFGDNPKTTYYP